MVNPGDNVMDKRRRDMKIIFLLDKLFVRGILFVLWLVSIVAYMFGLRYFFRAVVGDDPCLECIEALLTYFQSFFVLAVITAVWILPQYYVSFKLTDHATDPGTETDKADRLMNTWIGAQFMFMLYEFIAAEYFMITSFTTRIGCVVWVGFDCRCWVIAVACFVCAVKRGVGILVGAKFKDALEKADFNVSDDGVV